MSDRLSEAQNTVSCSDVLEMLTNIGIRSRQYYREHGGFVANGNAYK